jgi:hypothetical protein
MDIVKLLGLLGASGVISGVVVAMVTSRLSKSNELSFKINEQKLRRYKVVLLFMDAHLTPENIKYLNNSSAVFQLKDAHDVTESLGAEYRELMLYASKDVVHTVKRFINEPTEASYIDATLAMRRDLGMGKRSIKADEVSL